MFNNKKTRHYFYLIQSWQEETAEPSAILKKIFQHYFSTHSFLPFFNSHRSPSYRFIQEILNKDEENYIEIIHQNRKINEILEQNLKDDLLFLLAAFYHCYPESHPSGVYNKELSSIFKNLLFNIKRNIEKDRVEKFSNYIKQKKMSDEGKKFILQTLGKMNISNKRLKPICIFALSNLMTPNHELIYFSLCFLLENCKTINDLKTIILTLKSRKDKILLRRELNPAIFSNLKKEVKQYLDEETVKTLQSWLMLDYPIANFAFQLLSCFSDNNFFIDKNSYASKEKYYRATIRLSKNNVFNSRPIERKKMIIGREKIEEFINDLNKTSNEDVRSNRFIRINTKYLLTSLENVDLERHQRDRIILILAPLSNEMPFETNHFIIKLLLKLPIDEQRQILSILNRLSTECPLIISSILSLEKLTPAYSYISQKHCPDIMKQIFCHF